MPGHCLRLNKEIYELLQDSLAAKVVLGILIVLMLGFMGGTIYSMLSYPTLASYIIIGFQGICVFLCIYVILVGLCYKPEPDPRPTGATAPVRPTRAAPRPANTEAEEFQHANPLRDASQNA